jgi:PAS domain S-box-containing protein
MGERTETPGVRLHELPDDLLSSEERAALSNFASTLARDRAALATEWSKAVLVHLPAAFPMAGPVSPADVEQITKAFIETGIERLTAGDLQGLSDACYQVCYGVVQIDGARNLSLRHLYETARLGLKVAQSHVDASSGVLAVALGKLLGHLLMVLGFAYSDAREAALEQTRVDLECMVEERKAALSKEKVLADTIIESLPGIFYLFDDRGRFLRWNRNFETVSQYSPEEIAEMTPLDFFDDAGKRIIADRIGRVFAEGASTAEADFVSKDGTRRPHFFTGRRALVDDRVCLVGMAVDVTERRRAEEELQRSRTAQLFGALLESAPDAMVASNNRGEIVFVNSQCERLFDYHREELLGRTVGQLLSEEVREIPHQPGAPRHTATVETDGVRRDGSSVPVEVKLSPLETGEGPLIISAIRDVTERRRAEEEIRRLNVNLERRVAERTRELAQSNADLEQFAYVTSHDLQEPLRAVASYSQLLMRRYSDRLDGDALRFIERSVAAVGRMQALIRDLLQYARLGTRPHLFAQTDCETVLNEVLEDLQASIAETGAQVTHDPLPSLPADRSRFRQLLQNLIGNAIKFRGSNPPQVHVAARREGDNWLFRVRDNGIGIEQEYSERVFVIFQRLHSRRAYAGTGVGLAVCKRIVEQHGGRIWIEPSPRTGTTVCFNLPVQAAALDANGAGPELGESQEAVG